MQIPEPEIIYAVPNHVDAVCQYLGIANGKSSHLWQCVDRLGNSWTVYMPGAKV